MKGHRASGRRTLQRSGVVLVAATGVVLAALPAGARADDVVTTPTVCVDKPLTTLTWSVTLALPQFDPALGTLQTVHVTGNLKAQGGIKGENRDAQAADVTANVAATGTLLVPNTSAVSVTPSISKVLQNVTAFDGVDDLLGSSSFDTGTLSTFADFAPLTITGDGVGSYVGTGSWSASLRALGASSATGPSNLHLEFNTSAGGQVCVSYSYAPAPPTTLATTTTAPPPPTLAQLAPTTASTPNGQLPPTGRDDWRLWNVALLTLAAGVGALVVASTRRAARR